MESEIIFDMALLVVVSLYAIRLLWVLERDSRGTHLTLPLGPKIVATLSSLSLAATPSKRSLAGQKIYRRGT